LRVAKRIRPRHSSPGRGRHLGNFHFRHFDRRRRHHWRFSLNLWRNDWLGHRHLSCLRHWLRFLRNRRNQVNALPGVDGVRHRGHERNARCGKKDQQHSLPQEADGKLAPVDRGLRQRCESTRWNNIFQRLHLKFPHAFSDALTHCRWQLSPSGSLLLRYGHSQILWSYRWARARIRSGAIKRLRTRLPLYVPPANVSTTPCRCSKIMSPLTATRLCHPIGMVTMSQKEFQRVKVIENAAGGRLSVREAARLLHLSDRQVQRLKRRYRPDSVGWVQHGNRARAMPWAVSIPQKQLILTLARGAKPGFFRN